MTRPPTIHDVAAAAHVSHQTVSRVLNGATNVRPTTRARVQQAVHALGYVCDGHAAALARRRRIHAADDALAWVCDGLDAPQQHDDASAEQRR